MPNTQTVRRLFEVAISAEKIGKNLYQGLAKKFSYLAEVSDFWKGMLEDEIQHTEKLKDINDSLTPNELLAPADLSALEKANGVLKVPFEEKLNSVKTLDDAYELAHEFEYSEVNTVFQFLATKFISSGEQIKFIESQIENHLAKLMGFSQTFGNAERRKGIVVRNL